MRKTLFAGAALLAFTLAAPGLAETAARHDGAIVLAQAAPAAEEPAKTRRSKKKKEAASKREPTASQMAARERQKKCAAEWKSAKAGGNVASGTKWPKFWSACNARMKDSKA